MENVLFKISFSAEFHSQTAVEAAVTLLVLAKSDKTIDDIKKSPFAHMRRAFELLINKGRSIIQPIVIIAFNTWLPYC